MTHIRTHDAPHINIIVIPSRRREMCRNPFDAAGFVFIYLFISFFYVHIILLYCYNGCASPPPSPVLSTFVGITSRFSHCGHVPRMHVMILCIYRRRYTVCTCAHNVTLYTPVYTEFTLFRVISHYLYIHLGTRLLRALY